MAASSPPPPAVATGAGRGGPGRGRAVLVAVLAAVAVAGLGALGERTWLHRDLPLDAPAPAPPPDPAAARGAAARRRAPSPFLLVIVDGLREAAVPAMPAWRALVDEGGATGVTLVGDPTMSAPCVRALVTGRRPDLWTAFRNFDPVPVRGSVLGLLAARGLRVAHAGDPLLPRLCPDAYRPEDVVTVPRGRFAGPRELDDVVAPAAMRFAEDEAVDALTVHGVAVDLTGHASGADGAAYAAAVAATDARLGKLVLAFRRAHTGAHVLVAADHGLSPRGTHGAGEPEARRAPFVLVGPRVAARRGLELPQEAVAATLAVLLRLPPPPLAEAPPVLGLLRLTAAERLEALDGFAAARAAALRAAGRPLDAHALDEVRRATAADGRGAREGAVLAALLALDAPAPRRAAGLVAATAVACVVFLLLLAGAGRAAVLVGAGLAGFAAVAGAGAAFHAAIVGAPDGGGLGGRAATAAAVVGLAGAAVLGGPLRRARGGAGAVVALVGAGLALLRSMRLPVDGAVHLPLLVGAGAVAGTVVAALRAGPTAPRAVRVAFPLAAAAFVAATRGLEAWRGETWLADPATSVAAPLAVLLALAGVAALGARLPARGGAGLAVLVLVGGVAAFHALGGGEALGRIDPGRAFVPGAAGTSPATSWAAGLAGHVARAAAVATVLVAAATAALRRGGAADRAGELVGRLATATATGAATLVVGAAAWSHWSWWMVVAVPVHALLAVDAAALVVAAAVVLGVGGRRAAG